MSHFTVLVIGENPEKQLQPFHEYECTGVEDEYVYNVDRSEEVKEWLDEELYAGKKDGEYDYEHSEESAIGNLANFKKMARSEYFTLANLAVDEEVKDWFGYKKDGEKWTQYTNPNKKWDWYQLGGRWSGFFKTKLGVESVVVGSHGFMGTPAEDGHGDQLLKKDIDFDGMRNAAIDKALQRYEYATTIFGDLPVHTSWDQIRESNLDNIDKARDIYWGQPRCSAWQSKQREKDFPFGYSSSPDDFLISKEEYLKKASDSAIVTFAVIKDGKWYERGQMGWWAFVSNEKDNWDEEFSKLLDEVSDDTLLSVYDCHI